MSTKNLDTEFKTLKHFVQSLFSEGYSDFQKMVPVEEQEQEIDLLRQTLGGKRFLFIVDMVDFEICKIVGINRWLGYSDDQFSLHYYWDSVVHPQCQKSLLMIAHQLYGSLCTGKYPLQFMVQRYSSRVAFIKTVTIIMMIPAICRDQFPKGIFLNQRCCKLFFPDQEISPCPFQSLLQ